MTLTFRSRKSFADCAIANRVRQALWRFLLFAAIFSPIAAHAGQEGVAGWSNGVTAGYYATAEEACHAQWIWAGYGQPAPAHGNLSRFLGTYNDPYYTMVKGCGWTSYFNLCHDETGGGIGECGTTLPGQAYFNCSNDYYSLYPDRFVGPDGLIPQRPACKNNNGANYNPPAGNPILVASGAKILSATDYVSGDGKFRIGRNYRSFPVGRSFSATNIPLGLSNRWQFSFGMELQMGTTAAQGRFFNGNLNIVAPDGSGYEFYTNDAGNFAPRNGEGQAFYDYKVESVTPPSIYDASEWKVTDPEDRVWLLKNIQILGSNPPLYAVARPTSVTDRDGYSWAFTYNADGTLNKIVDTFGRTATFAWSYFYPTFITTTPPTLPEPEAVDTITFPDGSSVKYTYDPPPATSPPSTTKVQKLVGVTIRDASLAVADKTTYQYEDTNFPFALTGVTDNRNVRIATYAYDGAGRAVLTSGANGQNQTTVAYAVTGGTMVRTVTNPLGKTSVYTFTSPDPQLLSIDGLASPNCPASAAAVTYDNTTGFIATTTDEEGRVTKFTRDAKGHPLTIVQAFGTAAQRHRRRRSSGRRNTCLTARWCRSPARRRSTCAFRASGSSLRTA